jgi:uroporphyrin-III C-methyltransferase/precorrin-2 dehydrogenase/sirohydrochlorin ferrochelatase
MRAFLEHGAAPDLPVAVIDNGTRPNQTVVTGTVATLADRAAQAKLTGPAMIIVGTVVRLRDTLVVPAKSS